MREWSTPRSATSGSADPGLDRLKAVLDGWRNSLLDMGGRNRLLNFRHSRTATLELVSPDASAILAGLAGPGKGWDFTVPAPQTEEVEVWSAEAQAEPRPEAELPSPEKPRALVTQKATQDSLDRALLQLRGKSGQMFNDYGLWVLWLGVGMLDWREEGAEESSSAPLLLVPVELRRGGDGRARLQLREDQDRVLNPALAVKMEHLGLDWSPVTGVDVADLPGLLAAAGAVAAQRDEWRVEERVVLGLFASYKESMYQDLVQNEGRILDHALVRAVALGPDAGVPSDTIHFEPPELDRIDEIQLPERTPLVLDADASQRQCIAAALEGRSFVMSGPPGTGKSQTITNMIAALMHQGKSVLFVSEKAAALDVVRNRLRGVGLGDFVLSLHSGDTGRKAVATELARVLTTEARVTGAAEYELDRARQLREELSSYAAAMNQPREPLRRSLHDVLGRLALLDQAGTPSVLLSSRNTPAIRALGAGRLRQLTDAAAAVSRSWRPVAEGEAFVWRGLAGDGAVTVAQEAAERLAAMRLAMQRRPFAGSQPEPPTVQAAEQLVVAVRSVLPQRPPAPDAALPDNCTTALGQLAGLFGLPEPVTLDAGAGLLRLADLAGLADRPPASWFDLMTRERVRAALHELGAAMAVEQQARAAAADVFSEAVLAATDLPQLARRFAEEHHGVFLRFHGQYKDDCRAAAALTTRGAWEKRVGERLGDALAWQNAAAEVTRLAGQHAELLGRYTPRDGHQFAATHQVLVTADRIAQLTAGAVDSGAVAAQLADGTAASEAVEMLASAACTALGNWCDATQRRIQRWSEAAQALRELFDETRGTQLRLELALSIERAQALLDGLLADPSGPQEWHAYRDGMAVLAGHGTDELITSAAERGVAPAQLPAVVEQAVLKAWADDILATDARLRITRTADLDARVADFQEADRRLVAAAGGAVIEACNAKRPRSLNGGAAAVIIRQGELKTRHMPVRDLLARTRDVVRSVKPCFMMSPLTVSQFLPSDYQFDVVVFDEASQVRPSDAINCIYRGRSLVVAGDAKQLPPTSFFDASVDDDSDEYDEDVPDSFESLLDACKAGAMRELPLRWHYRSRHENLITFSNRSFYDGSMITFPGAREDGNDVGVAFLKANGVYDRGGRRENRFEAELVAERVIHHFDTRPGRTLGVVALSQAQASAIELAVQQARLRRPDLDRHFTEDRLDGFFIKNLESVQGDERDVMIMSIGYGPDEHGKLGLNFGPINRDGGWRRLNVAVTRARYRMEVVASFFGGSLADSANVSVQHLKRYLEYAQNGPDVLARDVVQEDAEPDSPFEESVLQVLRGWGYQVQPQVGVAGYRIDLGVRHPLAPGSYALGIECDGAMYHSSRAARDRDRLREQVLVGLGWRLHRIWGTDWYRGRAAAEERLREAVRLAVESGPLQTEAARTEAAAVPASVGTDAEDSPVAEPGEAFDSPAPALQGQLEPERVPVAAPERPWSAPYQPYSGSVRARHELHTPEARAALAPLMLAVIETEGPIHYDLLVQQVRDAWGVGKAGARIRENIETVLRGLVRTGQATWAGEFVAGPQGTMQAKARHPQDQHPARKFDQVAPAERRLALRELTAECPGMSEDELIRQTCEFFGWRRVTKDTRAGLQADLAELCAQGVLDSSDGQVSVREREG